MAPLQTKLNCPQHRSTPRSCPPRTTSLGRYTDRNGLERKIVRLPGAHGSTLVVDRLARGLGDARLVAHLCPDEPPNNAHIVASMYLSDACGRRCRALTDDDLHGAPPGWVGDEQTSVDDPNGRQHRALVDSYGFVYELAVQTLGRVKELRWRRRSPSGSAEPTTMRQVIGTLQSYEPARTLTARALKRQGGDAAVSVVALRAELDRIAASHIVLNRRLREAVLGAVQCEGMTLSEIAMRCGRIKHDANGAKSGETSWLARRIGLMPEGGQQTPTAWVSSQVLALIAREGLGVAPRDVELA